LDEHAKARRRLIGHVVRVIKFRNVYKYLVEELEEIRPLTRLTVEGKITLRCILKQ
jgi:hypothetical protein